MIEAISNTRKSASSYFRTLPSRLKMGYTQFFQTTFRYLEIALNTFLRVKFIYFIKITRLIPTDAR